MFKKTKRLIQKAITKDRIYQLGEPIADWEIKEARHEMRHVELLIRTLFVVTASLFVLILILGVHLIA